jgi:hypothetical protein
LELGVSDVSDLAFLLVGSEDILVIVDMDSFLDEKLDHSVLLVPEGLLDEEGEVLAALALVAALEDGDEGLDALEELVILLVVSDGGEGVL